MTVNTFNKGRSAVPPHSTLPSERAQRCACGRPFPLDRHPETGVMICATCYKKARQSD